MGSQHITYRCRDNGSDAIAHEEDGYFVVHAGSRLGEVRNLHDKVMLRFRHALKNENALEDDGLTLSDDEKFLYADEAARIITGCLVNEMSWTAPDGSHPTLVSANRSLR